MSNVKKEIMNQEIKQHESEFIKYFYRVAQNANLFYYDMLNNFSVSIWIPFLSDLLQYIHIFFYPFKENLSFIFKQKEFVDKLIDKYQYILFFPLIKSNVDLIIAISIVVILMIYITFIILIIISVFPKQKIKYYNFFVTLMRYILPSISLTFFGQIFEFLILPFLCEENENPEKYNVFKCPNDTEYYLFAVLSILALIFLLIIAYITISIYYKPSFMKDKNDSLKKISSFSNLVFFFNKILFIVLTSIKSDNIIYIWFMLIILFISTYSNMIFFTKYNNYENKLLRELNKFFSILLFVFISSLIIGKIFMAWGFNGVLHYFLFGIAISLVSAFLFKSGLNSYSYINFREISSACERLIYIQDFLDLIKTKHLSREKTLMFDSLILIKEENCIYKNCKLKKYLKSKEKGEPNDFILYQYCQNLFEIALKKFPDEYILKVNYISYLITQMSKRKLAEKVLYTMKFIPFQFERNYMVFCCEKFIKSYSLISDEVFKEENRNVMKKLEYDKLHEEFKEDLTKASFLYYDFWQTLYKYHMQGVENFEKLKNIGIELKNLINKVDKDFNKLHNVKGDDANLLYLYSGFIKYILDNKTKYDKLKETLKSISSVDKINDFEIDYTNFDPKFFEESDEHKFIMISAEEENFGTILNISHNASKVFGYTRCELIGKKFWILLPDICKDEFENCLIKRTNRLKIKFYDALGNKKIYIPKTDEMFINAKDKSKYLIPLYIKMLLVQTEESDHAYIMTISYLDNINLNKINDIFKIGSLFNSNKHKEEKLYNYCIVLTDKNFNIQTFSSNCLDHLGLNTNSMNSNIDITLFIPEFNEAVDNIIKEKRNKEKNKSNKTLLNLEDSYKNVVSSEIKRNTGLINIDNKIIYKRFVAEKNYSETKLVTFRTDMLENYLANNNSNIETTNIVKKLSLAQNPEKNKDKLFLLIIQKTEFNNTQVGYTFLFRREHVKCIEKTYDNIKSSISEISKDKNSKFFSKHRATITTLTALKSPEKLKMEKEMEINKNYIKKDTKELIEEEKIDIVNKKKIMKMPKSLDIAKDSQPKKGNIVGIIQSRIKNLLKEESHEKNAIVKKCSFKNFSSQLSLTNQKNKEDNDEFPKFYSDKNLYEKNIDSFNFVPKCNFNFSLDLGLMSFKPSYTLCKSNAFDNLLKDEAQKKLSSYQNLKNIKEKEKKETDSSDNYSSNEELEYSEDDDIISSSSKTHSDSKKNVPNKIIEKTSKKVNIKDDINKEYYRVSGLSKIKFMIFDFDQEMVVENPQKENKSEVENIIINYKLKLPTSMDKDSNDPSIKVNKFLLKYSSKDLPKEKIIRVNSSSQMHNEQKLKKQKESCKKLETELNKKGKERSIVLYSILCFFLNLIILAMAGFSLYFILSKLKAFKLSMQLIVNALLVKYYTNLGIYHIRMLTVTKINITYIPNNTDPSRMYYNSYEIQKNRTEYIERLINNIQADFFSGSKYLEDMIAMNVKLKEENEKKIYSISIQNNLVYDKTNFRNVSTSYMVGIAEIYSHFYYLITNIENLENYNSPELINFELNALNNAGVALNEIINVFVDEIKNKRKDHIKMSYILIFLYLFIIIVMFFLIKINYAHILNKRDSYISTFYQINLSFINLSIKKCEKFLNRLNPNELVSNKEENKNDFENSVSISNFDDNTLSTEQIKKNSNNNNQIRIKKREVKRKTNKNLIFIFISFLILIFVFLLVPILEFNNYITNFEIMSLYLYHMLHYHNNIINIYNTFSEFLFNRTAIVENTPVLTFLEKTITNTYDTFSEDIVYQSTNSLKIPGLYHIFVNVQKGQLCDGTDASGECEYYIQVSTSLGYYSFVMFWINEIKVKVFYAEELFNQLNTAVWTLFPELRTIILFNTLHDDIDYMFNLVVLHYIEDETNLTVDVILSVMNSRNNEYIAIYVIFMVVILILYFLYWNPFITDTQDQIYKTKLALNIIPVEILDSQTNIKNLLRISDLNE